MSKKRGVQNRKGSHAGKEVPEDLNDRIDFLEKELRQKQEESARKPEREQCQEYRPENTYTVGEAIFHNEWGIGKVVSKERTSGGDRAIVVAFEKLGERKLLENTVVEPDTN